MKTPTLTMTVTAMLTLGLTAGCASIVGKSVYPVAINSQPDKAAITIADGSGQVFFTGTTPTTVTLDAKSGYFSGRDYTITFTKEGFADRTVPVQRGVSGWYVAGNLFFGGLIGWLVVDPATGCMWNLPDTVTTTLEPSTPETAEGGNVSFLMLDDVPPHLRGNLVRLESR